MNGETLHDAISLLPEDLLTPVDQLRQKKRIPWRSITTVAACLCLAVGLWLINPDKMVATDSVSDEISYGNGAFPEKAPLLEGTNQSVGTAGYVMEVLRVDGACAVVSEPEDTVTEDVSQPGSSWTLTYENLKEAPQLQPGQRIRIYYEPEALDKENLIVRPYKIEIIEEETK